MSDKTKMEFAPSKTKSTANRRRRHAVDIETAYKRHTQSNIFLLVPPRHHLYRKGLSLADISKVNQAVNYLINIAISQAMMPNKTINRSILRAMGYLSDGCNVRVPLDDLANYLGWDLATTLQLCDLAAVRGKQMHSWECIHVDRETIHDRVSGDHGMLQIYVRNDSDPWQSMKSGRR